MGKNIVLFIDGTGKNGGTDAPGTRTNVWKLHKACNEPSQLQFYLSGVGSARFDAAGKIAGFGTKKRLETAYHFLLKNFMPGDNIFFFGFSRGALAVRLFADFLGYAGTLFGRREYRRYLHRVYQIYEASVLLNAADRFRRYMTSAFGDTRPLPIHFLGVWDTVAEYWSPGELPDIEKLAFHISYARHALALHERRGEMEPTLWRSWVPGSTALPKVMQVWFPGAHSDVGGGYREAKLAEAPLHWMSDEARLCGLNVNLGARRLGQQRILHQDRSGGALTGIAVKWKSGEGPRRALSDFPNIAADSQLLESLFVHQTACADLLDPVGDPTFLNYLPRLPGLTDPRARAREELKQIDTMTLQMALDLRVLGKKPIL
jgi:uncharacterized protein (DUF2235 family)